MRTILIAISVVGLLATAGWSAEKQSCPEQFTMMQAQAREFLNDRDAKQREKVTLQVKLDEARAKISALEKQVQELSKKPDKQEEKP